MGNNLYRRQIEAALEYIEHNIGSDLSLQTISKTAGFSPYHFDRIFHAVIGKSLHQYILERKLNCCASQLLYENCDITNIALNYGFATPSSFAKSFRRQFGCTPSMYKETMGRKCPTAFAKIDFREFSFDEEAEEHFSCTVLPDLKAMCIGVTGLSEIWENPEIEKAYQQIFNWLSTKGRAASNTKICGVTLDTPEVQDLSACRYYACAVVDDYIYDEHIALRNFQTAGPYICCLVDRGIKDFALRFFKYMDYLYGYYMKAHNLLPDYRPFVEFYTKGNDGHVYIDFCVPVKDSKK